MKLSKECFEDVINCILENSDISSETVNENGCIKISEFNPKPAPLNKVFSKATVAHDIKEVKIVLHILRISGIITSSSSIREDCKDISITDAGYKMLFNHYYQN